MTTSFDIANRTPNIPLPTPDTPKEPPLYQYFPADPYEAVTEGARLQHRRNGFYGLHRPAPPHQMMSNGEQTHRSSGGGGVELSSRDYRSVDPSITASSATNASAASVPGMEIQRNQEQCSNCSFACIAAKKVSPC